MLKTKTLINRPFGRRADTPVPSRNTWPTAIVVGLLILAALAVIVFVGTAIANRVDQNTARVNAAMADFVGDGMPNAATSSMLSDLDARY